VASTRSSPLDQPGDHRLLDIAEGGLAGLVEVLADGAADLLLDLGVAVDEAPAQLAGQLPPDRGLATAGHADKGDDQRVNEISCRRWVWCQSSH
jgi:hypothetical protein